MEEKTIAEIFEEGGEEQVHLVRVGRGGRDALYGRDEVRARGRLDAGQHRRVGMAVHGGRAEEVVRQLPGLVADARRPQGLGRARHQPARGPVQLTGCQCLLWVESGHSVDRR